MKFVNIFILIITVSLYSHGCALCKAQVPEVNVTVQERHTENRVLLDIEWKFQKYFSAETLLGYDIDRDGSLDKTELTAVTQSFNDYLSQDTYLTFIKYVSNVAAYDKAAYTPFEVSGTRTEFIDGSMQFSYRLTLPLKLQKGYELYISFFDKQNYFNFKVGSFELQENRQNKGTFISGGSVSLIPLAEEVETSGISSEKIKVLQGTESLTKEESSGILIFLEKKMTKMKE